MFETSAIIIFLLLVTVVFFWLYGFFTFNDLKIKTFKKFNFKRILIIYPHPDDEIFTVGGLVTKAKLEGAQTYLAVMTKGEKGESSIKLHKSLKEQRTEEIEKSAKIFGYTKLILLDLGDGRLDSIRKKLKSEVVKVFDSVKPDLVVTYDTSGMYGHPDHISLSEIVTEVSGKRKTKLWYSTFPGKIIRRLKMPDHMAKDKDFLKRRAEPRLKVWVGVSGILNKIKGLYAHKSQFHSFRRAFPDYLVPVWFFMSVIVFEYFYEVGGHGGSRTRA